MMIGALTAELARTGIFMQHGRRGHVLFVLAIFPVTRGHLVQYIWRQAEARLLYTPPDARTNHAAHGHGHGCAVVMRDLPLRGPVV